MKWVDIIAVWVLLLCGLGYSAALLYQCWKEVPK